MTAEYFEPFLSANSAVFFEAQDRLVALGQDALPLLESLFSGAACNRWGVPYRRLGRPVLCALATVQRLGPIAKPLEPWLRAELGNGDILSALALRALQVLEEESIEALALCIAHANVDFAAQAAMTLVSLGHATHPSFLQARTLLAQRPGGGARMLEELIERMVAECE